MKIMRQTQAVVLVVGLLFGTGACGSSDRGGSPQAGTERGTCYPNGTCDTGLTCTMPSNVCVRATVACTPGSSCLCPNGTTGQPVCGATGTTCQCEGFPGTGGVPSNGGMQGNGGILGGGGIVGNGGIPGMGGVAAGGVPNGGVGGLPGSGGASTCTDTSSDPMNCGACGRACRHQLAGSCVNGQCAPYWDACFRRDQFGTCNDYCASVGETCVAGGCSSDGETWRQWAGSSGDLCNQNYGFITGGNFTCDGQLPLTGYPTTLYRCCCTDTH